MKVDLNNWYRPEVDKKQLKQLTIRKDSKAFFHFIIYFGTLFISGYLAYITWGTWLSILFLIKFRVCNPFWQHIRGVSISVRLFIIGGIS